MKAVILGHGVEGKSAERYWKSLDYDVDIRDQKEGDDYLQNLSDYDVIVRSPGVKPSDILEANPGLDQSKITSVTNEFLEQSPAKVIGVTGTKGKGTTSTLIAKMLEAAGHKVWLGGNIGQPPLDFLSDINAEDWVILELSSFQLMDIRRSPHVAVLLMIAPDHLNWHPDMHEYITAKQGIFNHQEPGDRAIYNACNIYSLQAGLGAPGDQIGYNAPDGAFCDGKNIKIGDTAICATDEIALPGRHNWDNICAAITAVWPIIKDPKPINQVVREFSGLEHRLQKVATTDGVTYIDDSFSTNPETTIAAIQAYTEPKVLILGGSDKGASYTNLANEITHATIRSVILMGETAPAIKEALETADFTDIALGTGNMAEVVQLASKQAQEGDVVLLSPSCASFDLFKNYKDRGNQFIAACHAL